MTSEGLSRASVSGGFEQPTAREIIKTGIFRIRNLQNVFMNTAPHKYHGFIISYK
jgi:hypothetical protein